MKVKIVDEQHFQISDDAFAISAPTTGYTLMWSPDNVTYAVYDEYPAGEPLAMVGAISGL